MRRLGTGGSRRTAGTEPSGTHGGEVRPTGKTGGVNPKKATGDPAQTGGRGGQQQALGCAQHSQGVGGDKTSSRLVQRGHANVSLFSCVSKALGMPVRPARCTLMITAGISSTRSRRGDEFRHPRDAGPRSRLKARAPSEAFQITIRWRRVRPRLTMAYFAFARVGA